MKIAILFLFLSANVAGQTLPRIWFNGKTLYGLSFEETSIMCNDIGSYILLKPKYDSLNTFCDTLQFKFTIAKSELKDYKSLTDSLKLDKATLLQALELSASDYKNCIIENKYLKRRNTKRTIWDVIVWCAIAYGSFRLGESLH